jgi:hypothetical protein
VIVNGLAPLRMLFRLVRGPKVRMLTLVMMNVENKWMIAVAQNTDIVPTSR